MRNTKHAAGSSRQPEPAHLAKSKRAARVDLWWARWWIGVLFALLISGWMYVEWWPLHRGDRNALLVTVAASFVVGASVTRPVLRMASSSIGFLAIGTFLAFGFAVAVGLIR